MVAKREGRLEEGWIRRLGLADANYQTYIYIYTYTHIYRNYFQYPVINHNEKESFKKLVSSRKKLYEEQKSRQR